MCQENTSFHAICDHINPVDGSYENFQQSTM